MKVVVKLFAAARDAVGEEEVAVSIPQDSTVSHLRQELAKRYSALRPLLPHSLFAIEARYAEESDVLPEGAEVACIPPVSGG